MLGSTQEHTEGEGRGIWGPWNPAGGSCGYHEGVGLGRECVGDPVDGEGDDGHRAQEAAVHDVLQENGDGSHASTVHSSSPTTTLAVLLT